MKMRALSHLPCWLSSPLGRFRRDRGGVAAIEFAMIVPLMLVMFFGTVEVSSGVAARRKVSIVAQTISDLTSRSKSVVDSDVSNFLSIADAIMTPYSATHSATQFQTTITEVYIDPVTGRGVAQWSKGDVVRRPGTTVDVPSDLIAKDSNSKVIAGQYLIYSEVKYLYTPTVAWIAKAGIPLHDETFTRPRQSSCVLLNPASATAACPTQVS
ncbi:Flp pilus assembly protein TadG [Rhodopseudomonas rhenobacensis]|uniref:Flp pilus assembly protein TadG n=1 Tax=Rhodopseudomonas rhenobacensis TaxID=87461 RepID=A0A7W7Z4A7_9BRAD|nr:TadE/TadG family type IV pilus assembly protein [Rhodopseudomonas rhenobacensis]MBB5047367.1 Flp pilus assembly protein TadG [Rhodopseudomonas rhenobacensis]